MTSLHERLTSFVLRHPAIGGTVLAAVGVLMVADSIENAERFHVFEEAQELSAEVISISDSTLLPPRWDVTVAWLEDGTQVEADIPVGPKFLDEVKPGDTVEILVAEAGERVIFAAQRQTDHPVQLAGFEAMPLAYAGLIMSAAGALLALFGKRFIHD